ncbi:MAG: RRXRR domain-containing protein [Clostridiales bacterium]|nr:RRXRR domain-containing protein [Clostridiales bacterium]
MIGVSATTQKEELYAAEEELRDDIADLLSMRRAFEGSIEKSPIARCDRKTRHRQPCFKNHVHSKHKGWLAPFIENWLAPFIENKIQTHVKRQVM